MALGLFMRYCKLAYLANPEQAGLPVENHDADELVLRLLGMDNVGIPEYLVNRSHPQSAGL
jgi:hypothetical protein